MLEYPRATNHRNSVEEKMPARKSAKKSSDKEEPSRPLYAPPIYDAIKRGNTAEMKKLAAQARKHINEVNSALAALEKKIAGS
jgi:hypothetical protein